MAVTAKVERERASARAGTETKRRKRTDSQLADSALLGAFASAARTSVDLGAILTRTDPEAQARLLASLQGGSGNRAILRHLARGGGPLQRQAPSAAGTGTKHTYTVKTPEIKINKGIGPIKIDSLQFGGEASLDMAEGAQGEAGKANTQVRGGAKGGPDEAGYQAEVEHAVEEKWKILGQEFQPKVKLGGEVTNKGGEIGIEGTLEGQSVNFSMKFVVLGEDFEEGSVDIATLKAKVEGLKSKWTPVIGGKERTIETKGYAELSIEPDWKTIGRWLAQELAAVITAEAAIVFGFIAAGAATIAVGIYTIVTRYEIRDRVEHAAKELKWASQAYQSTMRGEPSMLLGQGAMFGKSAAQAALEKSKFPKPSIYEEAKKRNLESEAYAAVAPKIREKAIADYWEEHWFERKIYGEEGMGSGGFKTFKRVLDAAIPA